MTAPVSCCETSIWCCLCRAIRRCCKKDTTVTEVAREGMETAHHPTHTRSRTWKVSNDGKLRYEISQTLRIDVKG